MASRTSNNTGEWKPIPDPTTLTTEQLRRELAALNEQLSERIEGVMSTFSTRIDSIDKATVLFETNLNRVPTDVDKQIAHLRSLHHEKFEGMESQINEKFRSVDKQFIERDVRTESSARDSKVAVDAALQAAKEAVAEQNRSSALAIAKSEAATDKRIDQIVALVSTATSALDGKITDIKDRLVRIEGIGAGQLVSKTDSTTSSTSLVSILSLIVSVVLALFIIFHGAK